MESTEIVKQMVDSIDDLDTLEQMVSMVPTVPDNIADGFLLIKHTWKLGKVFREHALAMISRMSIEDTYKTSVKINGTCPNCGYVYEDVEIIIPPLTCDDCGLRFSEIPLSRKRIARYRTWEDFEQDLIEEIGMSHGVISNRISLYKRMLTIGMTWQESYDAILSSPKYCEYALSAYEWNSRGEIESISETAVIPQEIIDKPYNERIKDASEYLKDKIISEVSVIHDRYTKSEMIESAKIRSGRPVIMVYDGNPTNGTESFVMSISKAIDVNTSVEDLYKLVFLKQDGTIVDGFDAEVKDAIIKRLSVRSPTTQQRKRLWTW